MRAAPATTQGNLPAVLRILRQGGWRLAATFRGCAFLALWILFHADTALAHKGSDAYLDVQEAASSQPAAGQPAEQVDYRFSLAVAIRDLDLLVPIDANSDGKVTWGEVKAAMPLVRGLADARANLGTPANPGAPAVGATCQLRWQDDGVDKRSDGHYIRLAAQARCPIAQPLVFHYTLLREQDANHRLLVAGRIAGQDLLTTTSPLSPSLQLRAASAATAGAAAVAPQPATGLWAAFSDYFSLGVRHLLTGYDHLAFLLALVLPLRLYLFRSSAAAGRPPSDAAEPQRPPAREWIALLRTITAFTVGHSITLILASLGWTEASPRWVEPAIAVSIAVTALLNLRPVSWVRTDVLALVFGLVHGYGFAGLMLEAAAPSSLLPLALAGFNLGVEAGQIVAVCVWVLASQVLVSRHWYPTVVVRGGSMLLVLLAGWWFWERVG